MENRIKIDWIYQPWSLCDWTYNTEFDIDLVPAIVDAYEFQEDNTSKAADEGKLRAKNLLGLASNWDGGTKGTSPDNHGFDVLWMLLPRDSPGWPHAVINGTYLVIEYWSGRTHAWDDMFHTMQHELGHTYGVLHTIDYGYSGDYIAVMKPSLEGSEWGDDGNWAFHKFVPEVDQRISASNDRFDNIA